MKLQPSFLHVLTVISELLEDRSSVDVRAHSTWTVRWRAGEEKEPSVLLPASLRQFLQIQHLTKRHSPQRQN